MEEGKLTYASSFLFPKSSLKVILESLPDEQEINVKSSFSAFSPYHVRNIAIVIVFFCCSSEIFSFIIDTKHKMFSFVYIYLVELQDNKVGRDIAWLRVATLVTETETGSLLSLSPRNNNLPFAPDSTSKHQQTKQIKIFFHRVILNKLNQMHH